MAEQLRLGETGLREAAPSSVAGHREFMLRRLLAGADTVGIATGLLVAVGVFGSGDGSHLVKLGWGLATLPIWILLFKVYGLYDRDAKRVSHSTVDDLPWLFHALVVGGMLLWFWYRFATSDKLVFREGTAFFGVSLLAIFLARASGRRIARLAAPAERVLFVGGGPMARLLVQKIRAHPEYDLEPVGYVDDAERPDETLLDELPFLGTLEDVEQVCLVAEIERLVVAAPGMAQSTVVDIIRKTSALGLRISVLPQVVDVLGPSVEIDDVEGVTVLGVNPPALDRSSRFLKRTTDVVVAAGVLAAAAPVMIAAALAVALTSPGGVFFTQDRIGRGGRRFRILKFRTMVQDAERRAQELRAQSKDPSWLLLDHDPRITRVGRILRQTSIDELPQLLNVLKGDMSLVGPRPLPVPEDERIYGWGRRRLDLTPGITGLWQVLGRTNIPFDEMLKLDYLYVTNWSLWQDIRLLIHTLPVVLSRRGVN